MSADGLGSSERRTLALARWVRALPAFFVRNEDLRDAKREWASWVVPLLIVEYWLSRLPQLKGLDKR